MGDFDIRALVRPNILTLTPYRCARDDYSTGILLDANENSYGPALDPSHPSHLAAHDHYHRYPDPKQKHLRSLVAGLRNVSEDSVFLGVGSDEVLDLLIRVFCVPTKDKLLVCPPTYGMYRVCGQVNDVHVLQVPLITDQKSKDLFQIDVQAIKEELRRQPDVKIVFICSPGNPTSVALHKSKVAQLLEWPEYKGLVVIDEAYVDFVEEDEDKGTFSSWTSKYRNLVVLQTLSKSFGLAAIRIGIAIADPEVVHFLDITKAPYNVSVPTSELAVRALSPHGIEIMHERVAYLRAARERLQADLCALPDITQVVPGQSDANFILIRIHDKEGKPCSRRAQAIYRWMAETQGVVVRFRGSELGLEGCLRISIGKDDENLRVLETVQRALDEIP